MIVSLTRVPQAGSELVQRQKLRFTALRARPPFSQDISMPIWRRQLVRVAMKRVPKLLHRSETFGHRHPLDLC